MPNGRIKNEESLGKLASWISEMGLKYTLKIILSLWSLDASWEQLNFSFSKPPGWLL